VPSLFLTALSIPRSAHAQATPTETQAYSGPDAPIGMGATAPKQRARGGMPADGRAAAADAAATPVGCTPDGQGWGPIRAWMRREGVKLVNAEIATLPATGRAIAATADIAPGDLVVEIPSDALLMAESVDIAPLLQGAPCALSRARARSVGPLSLLIRAPQPPLLSHAPPTPHR